MVFCQVAPWQYNYNGENGAAWHIYDRNHNLKWTFQRTSCLLARLLGNMGVGAATPLLERFGKGALQGDSLQDLVDGPWLVGEGSKEIVLSTHWRGLPVARNSQPPAGWELAGFDDSQWRPIRLPGMWDQQYEDVAKSKNFGTFLHRLKFNAPAELAGQAMTLKLGALKEEDWTYVNGALVGSVSPRGGSRAPKKRQIVHASIRFRRGC